MKFSYPKQMFAIRAMALLAMLACILLIMGNADIQIIWLLGFALSFVMAVFITTITPMFTQHEIDADSIKLNQGAVFKTRFLFSDIETVEIYCIKPKIISLLSTKNKIVLASGNKGLVKIKLNHKRRFGMLLLRKADEITIDLDKPEEFVKLANEHLET